MKNHTLFTNLAKKDGFVYTTMAIIFTILFMLVVVDMAALRLGSIDDQTNREQNYKAKSAAATGRDLGLGLAADMSPGEEVEKSYICYTDGFTNPTIGTGTPPSNNPPCDKFVSTYEVSSLAGVVDGSDNSPSSTDDRYIVPPPGEGDAGENCIRPVNFANTAHTVEENIVKPCNWNKLYYGKAVAIPLYISVPPNAWNPQGVINPVDLPDGLTPGPGSGLGSFTIKVRTPCSGGHEYDNGNLVGSDEDDWCLGDSPSVTGPDARPELDDGDPASAPSDFSPRDIIVHWQIVSTCDYTPSAGNPTADDNYDGECIGIAVSPPTMTNRSDINKEAVNFAKGLSNKYSVVGTLADLNRDRIDDLNVNGTHPTILDYLKNNLPTAQRPPGTTSVTINRPILYLSAVSSMTTYINTADPEQNEYVPYIEYQIETDQPISDSNFTIRATGSYGNHNKTKKAKREIFNAFPSFVFQN